MARARVGLVVVAVAAFLGLSTGSRMVSGADSQTPVAQFKTGVDAVTLNVSVVDKQGHPVRGLRQEDFSVLEDGKPQRIVSFSEAQVVRDWAPSPAWRQQFSPDVATNGGNSQRLVVLLMSYRIVTSPWAVNKMKEIAHGVISRLGPEDLAAVVWSQRSDDSQGFTNDQAKLHAAIDRMRHGGFPSKCIRESVAEALTDFPDKRKVVINILEPRDEEFSATRPIGLGPSTEPIASIALVGCWGSGMPFAALVQRASTVWYNVDPNGLSPAGALNDQMANPTPGRTIANTNAPERAIDSIFAENSNYYLVAYESSRVRPLEGFHRLEVKVNRPGVDVHSPKNWYSLEPSATDLKHPKNVPSPLVKAMAAVLPDAHLPLRAVVAPFAATAGKFPATVAIALGVTLPGEKLGAATSETLEVEERAYDLEGKLRATVRQTATLALRADGADAHLDVLSQMDVKPNRYEIRMSISSSALKTTASVYADVLVPDFFKDPLSLSGIVVSSEPAITAAPRDALSSLLPIVPTTQREFAPGATARVFLRIYQRKAPTTVSMVTEIRDAADKVVVREEQLVPASRFGPNRSADFQSKLPLDRLPPGPYLVTITGSAGKAVAQRSMQILLR